MRDLSKVMKQREVIDYCGNPSCGTEIMFGQSVIQYGQDLLCSSERLCSRIGAVVITADDSPEHENDPTG